jgi:4-hydroxybenzoate decarboxylase
LEAALLLSCPPEIFLSACASLPYEASELVMAAQIAGGKIAMRRCKTIDLDVPASVDIVVEGRFLPNVKRPEGPFGEFMGNYVGVGDNHVFEVTHVSWRPAAVFHALVCGSPEDLRPLEAVTAARVYRHVSAQVPGVIDVCCRPNVMISIIKIRKTYEGQGKHAILAALGSYRRSHRGRVAHADHFNGIEMGSALFPVIGVLANNRPDAGLELLENVATGSDALVEVGFALWNDVKCPIRSH